MAKKQPATNHYIVDTLYVEFRLTEAQAMIDMMSVMLSEKDDFLDREILSNALNGVSFLIENALETLLNPMPVNNEK